MYIDPKKAHKFQYCPWHLHFSITIKAFDVMNNIFGACGEYYRLNDIKYKKKNK